MSSESPTPATVPRLPAEFRFGVATAAYQVEGAADEDGRGPSVWDTFCAEPGRVIDGSSGAVADDHYHRSAEDVALIGDLGVDSYRFSVSWSRIQPDGRGRANAAGLAFYDELVDQLLAVGVRPTVTLHHWDLPQALEDEGGWLVRSTIDAFADYAGIVGDLLGDRVADWIPVAAPNVLGMAGYAGTDLAPGRGLGLDGLRATHHLLVAHGRAAAALRARGAASIGCANNHAPIWPGSADPADVGVAKIFDALWNGCVAEPMLLGRYPQDLLPLVEDFVVNGDLATIRQPLDFYGIDYYMPIKIGVAPEDALLPFEMREILGHPMTSRGWPSVPTALREWLVVFRSRYRAALPPLQITGCGSAATAGPDEHGVIDDQDRIDFLGPHLTAVQEAIAAGVDVRGFYVTSLLDDFVWHDGYTQQYGLVHVDRHTLARTPKASFRWYADLVAAHHARRSG